jgi:bacterioferritin
VTYNAGVVIATEDKDSASKNIMEQIIRESEDSIDWLEAQLDLIDRLGIQNYLVTQVGEDAKSGH